MDTHNVKHAKAKPSALGRDDELYMWLNRVWLVRAPQTYLIK